MRRDRKLRIYFITLILLLNIFTVLLIPQNNIKAEQVGKTKLYFHEYDIYNLTGKADTNRPTKQNYSSWPPKIIKKDTSTFPANYTINYQEFVEWMSIWAVYQGLDSQLGLGYDTETINQLLENFGFNPYKITQTYQYKGQETINLNGAVSFDLYFTQTLASVSSGMIEAIPNIVKDNIASVDELTQSLQTDKVKTIIQYGDKTFSNTKKISTQPLQGKIQKVNTSIKNVDFKLSKGDSFKFSVQILPGDKLIGEIVNEFIGNEDFQQNLEDLTDLIIQSEGTVVQIIKNNMPTFYETINQTAILIKEVLSYSEETNIQQFLPEFANTTMMSSFIYNSVEYPSSITLPVSLTGTNENIKTYYLKEESQMDEKEGEQTQEISFKDTKSIQWKSPALNRNKILKEASTTIYIGYRDLWRPLNLRETTIEAQIIYNQESIATSQHTLSKNTFLTSTLNKPEPIVFEFEVEPTEIQYNDRITLKIQISNETNFGPLNTGLNKNIKLFYNSEEYPSYLSVKYDETDHIKIEKPPKSIPDKATIGLQEQVKYTLNVSSDLYDNITVEINDYSEKEKNKWDYSVSQEEFSVSPDETKKIDITLISKSEDINDYQTKDKVEINAILLGKTGIDSYELSAQILPKAVKHDVIITSEPISQKVKHGKTAEYLVKITNNNTGLYPDKYNFTITSKNNFTVF
ncbi:MAG: hypothetical protein V5A68_04870, partial [Candidatus Thermoplasmatota archaeon]